MANKDKLLESAQKFLAKGQLPKAIGEYQKLIEAFPKDYRNRQKLAELLCREKRNEEAQPHFEAVAKNFTETGFYLKAIAIYKQMQKIEPSRVDIYLRLAELNEKQGLIGNALGEYRSLVAFYDKNRMVREAIEVLKKMIVLEPENLGVRGKLIESLASIGESDEAFEQLQAVVRMLEGKGEHAKVVKLYEKFADLCPDTVESRLPLAVSLLRNMQAEKALPLLQGLLKQNPGHSGLLTVLIDCHLALGSHDDARLTCQHLLKENGQDLDLRERYIRICLAGADYERALESLEDWKEAFSQADRVGVLRELYQALEQALPGNARLQATLAAIYEATGETGGRPAFATAPSAVAAADETADAAVLDAAIGDVEDLDLVGEAVTPTAVPPAVPPAAAVPSAKPKGLELELDLDLGFEPEAGMAPPPEAAAAPPVKSAEPAPAAVPSPTPPVPPSAELEMEIELDLDGFGDLAVELPPEEAVVSAPPAVAVPAPVEEAAPPAAPEPEPVAAAADEGLSLEFDLGGLEEFEVEPVLVPPPVATAPAADLEFETGADLAFELESEPEPAPAAAPAGEPPLPAVVEPEVEPAPAEPAPFDLGELSLEPEPSTEPEPPGDEVAAAGLEGLEFAFEESLEPAGIETAAETEPQLLEFEEFVPESVERAGEAAIEESLAWSEPASVEPLEDLEEIEELEAVTEAEEAEPLEAFEAVEELEEAEPLEELEELEELEAFAETEEAEPLEELEELEELQEVEEFEPAAAAAPLPPAEPSSPQRLRDEIEEAEFFLRQGLFDDAERVITALQDRYQGLPELAAKMDEIAVRRQAAASAEDAEEMPPVEVFADLDEEELLGATESPAEPPAAELDEFSLESPVEEDEDAQSHFDLGIAYKEMGLYDDAVAEFGKASRDPSRQLDCVLLKGQCLVDMGNPAAAEETYRQALLGFLSEEGRTVVQYELGLLYESLGRQMEALEHFQMVADRDLFYRDVTDKLKQLRGGLGIDDQAIEDVAEKDSRRDRISYV